MKTEFLFLICACLTAASAFGGSETIIRERAKELRDQNNVRQGVAPATPPAPVAGGNVAVAPAQSPAVARLQADLTAIQAGSVPTVAQKQRLAQDLITVAQGSKPSVLTASNCVERVSAALAEKSLSAANLARFVQELDAVLNPRKYPQAKPDGIFADIQAIFQENGLQRNKAVAIADSVKALAAEARK